MAEDWLSTEITSQGPAATAKTRLIAAYGEPQRRYHTLSHIDDCLTQLRAADGLSPAERQRLAYAIWWHDAVYDPTRSDNEAQSAEMARRDLVALGEPAEAIDEVARLIALTKGHAVEAGDRLGGLLVSIDLSILGREPAAYAAYAAAVREEYGHVPDALFRPGRAAVLEHLLAASPLYPDAGFRHRFEDQARRNMAAERAALLA